MDYAQLLFAHRVREEIKTRMISDHPDGIPDEELPEYIRVQTGRIVRSTLTIAEHIEVTLKE